MQDATLVRSTTEQIDGKIELLREPVRLLTPPRVSRRGYAPGCGKAFVARMRQWLQALLQPCAACAYCQRPLQPHQDSDAYDGKLYHASCLILLKRIVEQERRLRIWESR